TTAHIEQTASSGVYAGTWYTTSRTFFSGGSAASAVDSGSKLTFTFSGVGVRAIGYRDEWSGAANIYLDGQLKATIDTYATPAPSEAGIRSATGLASASHPVVIEVPGTHSSASGGSWVWIDAFEVDTISGGSTPPSTPSTPPANPTPPATPTPPPTTPTQ